MTLSEEHLKQSKFRYGKYKYSEANKPWAKEDDKARTVGGHQLFQISLAYTVQRTILLQNKGKVIIKQ